MSTFPVPQSRLTVSMNPSISSSMNLPGMNPPIYSGMTSGGLNTVMNSGMNSGMGPGMNPGLGMTDGNEFNQSNSSSAVRQPN